MQSKSLGQVCVLGQCTSWRNVLVCLGMGPAASLATTSQRRVAKRYSLGGSRWLKIYS